MHNEKSANKVNFKLEKVSSKVIIKNGKDKRVSRFKWFLTLSPRKLSKLFPYVFEFLMTNSSFRILELSIWKSDRHMMTPLEVLI